MTKYLVTNKATGDVAILDEIQVEWLVGHSTWKNRLKPLVDGGSKVTSMQYEYARLPDGSLVEGQADVV
jgi:hypothetical protein